MDIFGFKKRKFERGISRDSFNEKKRKQYVRNIKRLKEWMDDNNTRGVELIQRYLEDNGMPPPQTQEECDILKEIVDVE